ncbi:MAG: hypothetical protein ACP5GJ_04080 [Nanopusillaceae archaeon]
MKNPFKTLLEAYKYTFSLMINYIKYKFGKAAGVIKPTNIDISQLPRDEQTRILTEQLLKERQEKILSEEKAKQLEEELNKLRSQAFGKILEELYEEEKATGKLPISLYDLLRRARSAGLLPFRKPPVVYDITKQKLGYLKDIIIHPDGGIAFVIKAGKEEFMTPPFGSLWEAIFHPENLASQLPESITLLLYKDPTGNLVKVPAYLLNRMYGGEPAEKIIGELQQTINRLVNDLESTKVNAEMISVQNQIQKVYNSVASTVSTASLNLYEKTMRDIKNIVLPTTLAAVESSTAMQLDVAQERSKSEHLQDLINEYSARIKTLETSLAPEKIIAVQNDVIDKLKQLSAQLAEIRGILSGNISIPQAPQQPQGQQQPPQQQA